MTDSKAAVIMVAHISVCRVGFLHSALAEARHC